MKPQSSLVVKVPIIKMVKIVKLANNKQTKSIFPSTPFKTKAGIDYDKTPEGKKVRFTNNMEDYDSLDAVE